MKRTVTAPVRCTRVRAHLSDALATGELALPPELAAHVARCHRCSHEVKQTQLLFSRLSGSAAAIDTGPAVAVTEWVAAAARAAGARQPVHWRWVLGQVAVLIALLVGLSIPVIWGVWRAGTAVAEHPPRSPASQVVQTFSNWVQARLDFIFGDVRK